MQLYADSFVSIESHVLPARSDEADQGVVCVLIACKSRGGSMIPSICASNTKIEVNGIHLISKDVKDLGRCHSRLVPSETEATQWKRRPVVAWSIAYVT